jgi:acetolactate synthase-1/2/3 large subunit
VILDNSGYQSIAAYQDRHFSRRLGTDFDRENGGVYQIDYIALARAYGADGERVHSIEMLPDAIERGLSRGGNYVLHVPTHNRPRPAASGQWDVNDIMSGKDPEIVPAPLDAESARDRTGAKGPATT